MENDFTIAVDPHFISSLVEENILSASANLNFLCKVDKELLYKHKEYKGLNAPHNYRALFTIELTSKYVMNFSASSIAGKFIDVLQPVIDIFEKSLSKKDKSVSWLLESLSLNLFSVYYIDEKTKLQFIQFKGVPSIPNELVWGTAVDLISRIKKNDRKLSNQIEQIPIQKNGMRFFAYDPDSNEWQQIDRLLDASLKLSKDYRNQINDSRVRKPYIVFNEDNYNEYFHLENQWRLKFEEIDLIMPQPNDISIYMKLAEQNLHAAEVFYFQELKNRKVPFHFPLLSTSDTVMFYNYFEKCIAAITFSYTSLEAFANICIPKDFTYSTEKSGVTTTYNKEAIERTFTLREKFKKVLKEILQTSEPADSKWWNRFIYLEDLRNEIIHTKQSKSEERYSALLRPEVFSWIKVNKDIIEFYGEYLAKTQRNLLFDFPYDCGQDSVPPSFISNDDYLAHYNELHNPFPVSKT